MIAIFLLVSAGMVIAALFHSALRHTATIEQESIARLLAQSALAEARARASSMDNLVDSNPLQRAYQDPDHPGFRITVNAEKQILALPNSSLLKGYIDSEQATLDSSAAKVTVRVTWDDGRKSFLLCSLVEEKLHELDSVLVSGGDLSLGPGESTFFEAAALNSEGEIMQDVRFVWWVEPISGNALIFPDYPQRRARLLHQSRAADGSTPFQPGLCRVAALARYRGKEVVGYSSEIFLSP